MITLQYSPRYLTERKKFLKYNPHILKKTVKAIKLLSQNPHHPRLHPEKLRGSKLWAVRIDKGNRIFLSFSDGNTVLLLDIGPHDKYRKYQ